MNCCLRIDENRKAGKPLCWLQTYYGMEEVISAIDGRIVAVSCAQGDMVSKGEVLAFVE